MTFILISQAIQLYFNFPLIISPTILNYFTFVNLYRVRYNAFSKKSTS